MSLPDRYGVYRDDQLVMEVRDEAGLQVSVSAPPPAEGEPMPPVHAFAAAAYFEPALEGELAMLLRSCSSLPEFLAKLRAEGYRVELIPWPE
jgi:hypothetical protein